LNESNQNLSSKVLEELFADTLFKSPAVSIQSDDKVRESATLLSHYLESFTDSLVITNGDRPIGLIGGKEILDGLLKKPTFDFFENVAVKQLMDEKITIVSKNTKLSELIKKWQETRRAFAILSNPYSGYSAISARKILEIAIKYGTSLMVSDIPKKKIITFSYDFSIKKIINLMFENKTRKLILEGTSEFISDRIIIEKIVRDLNYLHDVSDFLNMPSDTFKLEKAKTISDKLTIQDASKLMYAMTSPYLIVNDQVLSPWDVVQSLQ